MKRVKLSRSEHKLVNAFKRDLPEILDGNDPMLAIDRCEQCGMTFQEPGQGSHPEWTVCAEPGCGRRFGHGSRRGPAEVLAYRGQA